MKATVAWSSAIWAFRASSSEGSSEAFGFGEAFVEGFEDFFEVLGEAFVEGLGDSFGVSSISAKFLGTLRQAKNFWISPWFKFLPDSCWNLYRTAVNFLVSIYESFGFVSFAKRFAIAEICRGVASLEAGMLSKFGFAIVNSPNCEFVLPQAFGLKRLRRAFKYFINFKTLTTVRGFKVLKY